MSQPAAPAVRPKKKSLTKAKPVARLTPQYKVLLHNDDITPAEYVVTVLLDVFKLSKFKAMKIMLKAHFTGIALVAVLPLEQAELRIDQAHSLARARKYPLTFSCEPA